MVSPRGVGIALAVALTGMGSLGGCAVGRSDNARRAQTDLVGLSKPELFRCAGLPDQQETVGNEEFITYRNDLLTSGGVTIPIIGGGVNFFDSKYCHATFVLRNGRTQALHYAGNASSPFAELDQCGYVVNTCIERLDHVRKEAGRPVGAAELSSAPAESDAAAAAPAGNQTSAAPAADKPASAAATPRRVRGRP